MAVYTKINDAELQAFLTQYQLGECLELSEIPEGIENTNYRLRTHQGYFILTIFERRVFRHDLPFFLSLMGFLSDGGICCPVPIMGRDGQAFSQLCGKPAAVLSYLPGSSINKPNLKHCSAVGSLLADLHNVGLSFPGKRSNNLALKDWPKLLSQIGSDGDLISPGIKAELGDEIRYLEGNWPEGLPEGVIHGDLFPDNVLFLDGEISGVIDFYFSCRDFLAYDLGVCLNAWAFDDEGEFDKKRSEALLRGYCNKRGLTKNEYELLPILCRGSALRFLLTRLYDHINVPVAMIGTTKDPLEYHRRLCFHRNVTNADAYGELCKDD
ncbi:MAG: homoserine kinase [Pseudomonadota bacterium]|nr:homoserine kinase [Pseudomonadota bacterium]